MTTLLPPASRQRVPASDAPPQPPATTRRRRVQRGRVVGLDGLRGLLAIIVLVYHGGAEEQIPGGIISMDVFFVLSGFLITGLMLAEHERHGRISLYNFWARRARRLLPAVLVLLVTVPLVWRFYEDPTLLPKVRSDALATLGYVANWHAVWTGTSYFDALGPPSPLLHTWSLGVEEQFYLVWPLVVVLVLRWLGKRGLLALCVVGALASSAWAGYLSVSGASPSRMYYGTDVRCQALLVGAAAAIVLRSPRVRQRITPRLGAAAAAAGVGLAACIPFVDGRDPKLYRGEMLLIAGGCVILCAGLALRPDTRLTRALSFRPLAALGVISYGTYLWHWPVDLFATRERLGLSGVPVFFADSAITVTIATLSYLLLEKPIRTKRLRLPHSGAVTVVSVAAVAAVLVLPVAHPVPTLYTQSTKQRKNETLVTGPTSRPAAPVPTVLYYGDSIGYEAMGTFRDAMLFGGNQVRVVLQAFPATSVCDYLPRMKSDIEQYHPKAVVLTFLGVAYTPCMRDANGVPLSGQAQTDKVAADAKAALDVLTSDGATVFWTSDPPAPRLSYYESNTAAERAVVLAHPHAVWVDAGKAVAPNGQWVKQLPCLPGEPCQPNGMDVVRGPDNVHFCPTAYTYSDSDPPGRCPVWASGAWRYGLAQASAALQFLGLKLPDRVVIPPPSGHTIPTS